MRLVVSLIALVSLVASVARAAPPSARGEEVVLRLGTMAPAGTAWARELNAFAREVDAQTRGQLRVKWYFGGITGDEVAMGERIRRGQLDGAASGGPLCESLAPSMRVMRVVGILTTAREAGFVASRLWATFEKEFHRNGVVGMGTATIGPHIMFSRRPIRNMAELKQSRLWIWDRDDVLIWELKHLGINIAPMPVADAARAYEDGRIDGFLAPSSVALAFQWSALARYATDLRLDYLTGCVVVAERSFDPLPQETRDAIRSAAGKLAVRFAAVGEQQDDMLMNGLFKRQGVTTVPVDSRFSTEFFEAARNTRDHLDDRLVPRALIGRVLAILADYRAAAASR